jgi:chromosome partitioning protein
MEVKMGKIISIANQKGGVGKTTTSVNLSSCLALAGKKVLLIDADPQGNATSGVGANKNTEKSTYDIIINQEDVKNVVQGCAVENLYVCASNINLAGAEVQLVSQLSREHKLKEALDKVKDEYDYIIIDCPPSLGIVMAAALVASDGVLIPIQAEFLAMDGLALITSSINNVRKSLNPNLELNGIVFTMVNSVARLTVDVMNEVRAHFGDKVYETSIPRNVRVSEAPSMGAPVVFFDPRSKGAESYKAFAWEFMAKNPTRIQNEVQCDNTVPPAQPADTQAGT